MRAIIIDDEEDGSFTLQLLLRQCAPEVKVVAVANSAEAGIEHIEKLAPDLVFLDIEMPFMNGFEILQRIGPVGFEVVFTTAYDQYAVKAFKANAVDYLLKPIDPEELIQAVERTRRRISGVELAGEAGLRKMLINMISRQPTTRRIAVSSLNSVTLVNVDNIVRCEADSNYTIIYLSNGEKLVACKTLKEHEEMLIESNFFRANKSVLVNVDHIEKYIREDGGYLLLSDGSQVDVAKRKRTDLLQLLHI